MDTKYIDELILHEYGKHDLNKYNEWVNDWHKWLKDENTSDKPKVKSMDVEQTKVHTNSLNKDK